MKKSLLALLFAVALVVPALAENMWVGGSFEYKSVSAKALPDTSTDADANSFTIAPEFGYSLDETWDIGLDLSYTSTQNDSSLFKDLIPASKEGFDSEKIGIKPFARYHVTKIGCFDIMLQGSVFYNTTTYKEITDDKKDVSLNSYGIAIAPVISYSINETWSIGATLNFLELGYTHSSSSDIKNTKGDEYSCDEFGFNVNNGSIASIGFSYHF